MLLILPSSEQLADRATRPHRNALATIGHVAPQKDGATIPIAGTVHQQGIDGIEHQPAHHAEDVQRAGRCGARVVLIAGRGHIRQKAGQARAGDLLHEYPAP